MSWSKHCPQLPVAPAKNQSLEPSRDPSRGHRGAWRRRLATCWNHVAGHTHRSEQYISEKMEERITKERVLWEAIPTVPDLQCAWQILFQSANPRANHTMRTMPPGSSASCCQTHDEGIWAARCCWTDSPSRRDNRDRESSIGHASDADGRSGVAFSCEVRSSGVLGILG